MTVLARRSLRALGGAAVALALWGCYMRAPTVGLAPEYPAARLAGGGQPVFIVVDSLRPTLRWSPFAGPAGGPGRIGDVSYELRIWQAEGEYPAELVYARERLESPWHTVEAALRPASRYFWTVRARFAVDGEPRVSPWGTYVAGRDRRLVPSPYFYRFRTPDR